ncbi:MAG: pyrroline-5-carboxylate reductase [Alphaproteobacteria bacterium]|nr:pyrroline-5-carboxylate reductase [Alphaproteobacteria bacterium]
MSDLSSHIILVGSGKMGGGILRGWLRQNDFPIDQIFVIEPQAGELAAALAMEHAGRHNYHIAPDLASIEELIGTLAAGALKAIIFAIKPQVFPQILPLYRELAARHHPILISIAAGQTLQNIAQYFPDQAIIRTMPNLPASIGRGVSVAVANAAVSDVQKNLADRLMAACGASLWIDDEAKIDAVTAVSGSGPAYVFYLTEILAEAAQEQGLDGDLAHELARKTVMGAAALLEQSTESAATLRQNVTSPGGTTAAALQILMSDTAAPNAKSGFAPQFKAAIAAAAARSRELAGK